MTFSDIYSEVISIRFNNNYVTQSKRWVNQAYAYVWNQNDWTFRYATASPTTTAGSNLLATPTALQRINYLYDDSGIALGYLPPAQFFSLTLPQSSPAAPSVYTVVNGQVLLGPTPLTTATYTMVYEQKLTTLVADLDVPLIPTEYHYMLVHGALFYGMSLQNDFTYAMQEEMFNQLLANMTNAYTSDYGGTLQYQVDTLGNSPIFTTAGDA